MAQRANRRRACRNADNSDTESVSSVSSTSSTSSSSSLSSRELEERSPARGGAANVQVRRSRRRATKRPAQGGPDAEEPSTSKRRRPSPTRQEREAAGEFRERMLDLLAVIEVQTENILRRIAEVERLLTEHRFCLDCNRRF